GVYLVVTKVFNTVKEVKDEAVKEWDKVQERAAQDQKNKKETREVADLFRKAIKDDDLQKAHAMTSSTFNMNFNQFQTLVNTHAGIKQPTSLNSDPQGVNGSMERYQVSFSADDPAPGQPPRPGTVPGMKVNYTLVIVKEKDAWKIAEFKDK